MDSLIPPALQETLKINVQLRVLRMRQCRKRKRETSWGLPDRWMKVVVAACVLSEYDLQLAQHVGRMLREQMQCMSSKALEANPVPVQDWFLLIPLSEAEAFHDPITQMHHSIRSEALKWIS